MRAEAGPGALRQPLGRPQGRDLYSAHLLTQGRPMNQPFRFRPATVRAGASPPALTQLFRAV